MRFLHTSDWHVGKALRGRDRADEHRAVLAEIAGIARDRAVDFTLVCGDQFDQASPTPESERIVYRALLDLAEVAPVLIVSGNHDNDRRLSAVQPLLDLGRVITRATPAKAADGGVVELTTEGGERARIAMLPWISQRYIIRAQELMELRADDQAGRFAERLGSIIGALCDGFGSDAVNIVAGHAMVAGGGATGSERKAHLFDYAFSPTTFPASAHYVALGHLHRAQMLGGQPPVWYCGSPLELDFGEAGDDKHVLVVEATPTTPASVEQVRVRAGRRLRRVVGTLDDLRAIAGTTGDDWLDVVVRSPARAGLGDEVRELFGECCVGVGIETDEARELGVDERAHAGKSPGELFREYLDERDAADERVIALFDELLEEQLAPVPAEGSDAPAPA